MKISGTAAPGWRSLCLRLRSRRRGPGSSPASGSGPASGSALSRGPGPPLSAACLSSLSARPVNRRTPGPQAGPAQSLPVLQTRLHSGSGDARGRRRAEEGAPCGLEDQVAPADLLPQAARAPSPALWRPLPGDARREGHFRPAGGGFPAARPVPPLLPRLPPPPRPRHTPSELPAVQG